MFPAGGGTSRLGRQQGPFVLVRQALIPGRPDCWIACRGRICENDRADSGGRLVCTPISGPPRKVGSGAGGRLAAGEEDHRWDRDGPLVASSSWPWCGKSKRASGRPRSAANTASPTACCGAGAASMPQHGAAAFAPGDAQRGGGAAATHRRAGTLLRATGAGERGPKKGAQQQSVAERQTLMAEIAAATPALSLRRLCTLLGLSRSWWYEQQRLTRAGCRRGGCCATPSRPSCWSIPATATGG